FCSGSLMVAVAIGSRRWRPGYPRSADTSRQLRQPRPAGGRHREPVGKPLLVDYGAGFPAVIETFAPARGLLYLADAARLDWALNEPSSDAISDPAAAIRRRSRSVP